MNPTIEPPFIPSTPPCRCSRADTAGWLMTGTVLTLMPKCPLCLAAYVSLFTGMAISFSTADLLRSTLIYFCSVLLLILTARALRTLAKSWCARRNFQIQSS